MTIAILSQEGWAYDPFEGHIDDNGVIYGRGTQDMKSVSIQYYEALRRLKGKNVKLLRNVYMTLMPGELQYLCRRPPPHHFRATDNYCTR